MEHVKTAANIELMVNVLTMGYWPTYIPMDVVLPEEVMHFHVLMLMVILACNQVLINRLSHDLDFDVDCDESFMSFTGTQKCEIQYKCEVQYFLLFIAASGLGQNRLSSFLQHFVVEIPIKMENFS